ncbi:hypothetical protein HPP92_007238 [Vanilla planifolia]|uniref:Uncharacterized protein n=1 Tax=Vanilla planifolia TaxID=51239 RepID=A0A835RLZ3_VANPL|nr:hypothetical protein HPP92_007238 [Vanilla planifolia]
MGGCASRPRGLDGQALEEAPVVVVNAYEVTQKAVEDDATTGPTPAAEKEGVEVAKAAEPVAEAEVETAAKGDAKEDVPKEAAVKEEDEKNEQAVVTDQA